MKNTFVHFPARHSETLAKVQSDPDQYAIHRDASTVLINDDTDLMNAKLDTDTLNKKKDTAKISTPFHTNDTDHNTRDASSGPEVGTLDEVDLFPPLLADIFVVGQKVKIAQSLTVGEDKLPMKAGTEGRSLATA